MIFNVKQKKIKKEACMKFRIKIMIFKCGNGYYLSTSPSKIKEMTVTVDE